MKQLKIFVLIGFVLLALTGCNLLQITGSVSGTVLDETDKPLNHVCIKIEGKTVFTDSTGYFFISGLNTGSYVLTATKDGYQDYSNSVYIEMGKNTVKNITMETKAPTTGSITGTVKDSNNQLLANVYVTCAGKTYTTTSQGTYTFTNIAPGTYSITASKAGYQSYTASVSVLAGNTANHPITLVLANASYGALTGTVKIQGTNTPIAGVEIKLNNTLIAQSDSQGFYSVTNVLAGTYTLQASKVGYNTLSANVTIYDGQTSQYDIQMVQQPVATTGNVTGTVKNALSNLPLAGVLVTVGQQSVTTNADGVYLIEGITAGTCQLSAMKDGFQNFATTVMVTAGSTIVKDFSLQPISTEGTLQGYVTDGRGGPAVPGATVTYAGLVGTTDLNGYFEMQVPGNTTGDVMIQKQGRASSKIQGFSVLTGGSAYFEVPNKVAFNPGQSLIPPTIYVTGIQPNATVTGTITFTVQVQGNNAAAVFYVYLGGEQRYPVERRGIEIDADSVSINTTLYPNGLSYIKVLAYDDNENATMFFVPVNIQNTATDLNIPTGITHLTAYSVTYGQNLGYYQESRQQFFAQHQLLRDPSILELPSGRELSLASFTVDGTICNKLLWAPVAGADGYRVYRSFDGNSYEKIGDVHELISTQEYDGATGFYDDFSAQLAPGKKTYYKVIPYNSLGSATSVAAIDVTPLPPLNVSLQTPTHNAVNVSLTPIFYWIAQSNGLSFPGGTLFMYGFSIFDATEYLVWDAIVEASTQYILPQSLMPNSVYSWDIYDGIAEKVYRNDATGYSSAISVVGSGYGSTNGEFIFTTTLGQ